MHCARRPTGNGRSRCRAPSLAARPADGWRESNRPRPELSARPRTRRCSSGRWRGRACPIRARRTGHVDVDVHRGEPVARLVGGFALLEKGDDPTLLHAEIVHADAGSLRARITMASSFCARPRRSSQRFPRTAHQPALDGRPEMNSTESAPYQNSVIPAKAGTHMWTAPVSQGHCSCDGSGRMQSYVRPLRCGRMTAGPDGVRGSGLKQGRDV